MIIYIALFAALAVIVAALGAASLLFFFWRVGSKFAKAIPQFPTLH